MKKTKTVPKFKTIEEMANFWDTHSTADYPDFWEPVTNLKFSRNLKSTYLNGEKSSKSEVVQMRLDKETISAMEKVARQKGVGTSTAARMLIRERLSQLRAI